MRSKILRSNVIDMTLHGRLLNWGRYLRSDNTFSMLNYPSSSAFVVEPTKGMLISELDAEHIEVIVSSFMTSDYEMLPIHAIVLKVEYAERSESRSGPVEERAKDIGKIFKTGCSRSTYFRMLAEARNAVDAFADPL